MRAAPAPLLGLEFRNRVGVGAGFDKDAVALRGWEALGLGFIEVGTVTPLAQGGNPRPRLFRLPSDEALINRMGFNNAGAAALARNVMLARRHLPAGFVVGVNIGRGAATPADQAIADYLAAFRLVAPVADYVAINVSSPNTPGLRDLQQPDRLRELLATLRAAGEREAAARPLLVKLAPDLEPDAFAALVAAVAEDADGLILSNTTTARDGLASAAARTSPAACPAGRCAIGCWRPWPAPARCWRARSVIIASGGIGSAADVADAYAGRRRPGAAVDGPRLPRAGADRRGGGGERRIGSDTIRSLSSQGRGQDAPLRFGVGTDEYRDLRRGCPRFGAAHPHRAAGPTRPGLHRARRGRGQPQPHPGLSAGRRVGAAA